MLAEIREAVCSFESRNRSSAADMQARLDIEDKTRTSLFPWRGQFSPQLVEHLLSEFAASGMTVMDPFCGSGTVLAEAARCNLSAVGYDINPAAYLFAAMHEFCTLNPSKREIAIRAAIEAFPPSSEIAGLFAQQANDEPNYFASVLALRGAPLLIGSAALMLAMGDSQTLDPSRVSRALRTVVDTIRAMPYVERHIEAQPLDCRKTPLQSGTVDLAITSPPYINVFNYHQNYRPALERLGWQPLRIAVAEIGANRKHRQNRFLTVIQYAMDMGLALAEMHRVLTPDGRIVLIVGRCSSVRRISFPNGMMLALVAQQAQGFTLEHWRERQFMNRFGDRIFEDVLVLRKNPTHRQEDPLQVGRSIGVWALENGLASADGEVLQDMKDALASADNVHPSVLTSVIQPPPFQSIKDDFTLMGTR